MINFHFRHINFHFRHINFHFPHINFHFSWDSNVPVLLSPWWLLSSWCSPSARFSVVPSSTQAALHRWIFFWTIFFGFFFNLLYWIFLSHPSLSNLTFNFLQSERSLGITSQPPRVEMNAFQIERKNSHSPKDFFRAGGEWRLLVGVKRRGAE